MSKSDPNTNKVKPRSYRWPLDINTYIEEYKDKHGVSDTKAVVDIMRNGILLELNMQYNKEENTNE